VLKGAFQNRFNQLLTLLYLAVAISVYLFTDYYKEQKINEYKASHFDTSAKNVQSEIQTLIEEKQHATLAMAVSLAQNKNYVQALKQNDASTIDLQGVSNYYKQNTSFKNVWLQISDKEGKSFKRSWTQKSGDDLLAIRKDLQAMHKDKKLRSSISVGIFSISFKSMVPIIDNGEFLGVFEIITHFNSIDKILQKKEIESVVLADKGFESQLHSSITKTFVDGYYVANLDANPKVLDALKGKIDFYVDLQKHYHEFDANNILTVYTILSPFNERIGYYVTILPKNIDTVKIDAITTSINLYAFVAFIVLSIVLFLLIDKQNIVAQLQNTRKKKMLIFVLLGIFLLFEISLYLLLFNEKALKSQQFLKEKTVANEKIFAQSYHQYKMLASVVFQNSINTEHVRRILLDAKTNKESARERLYEHLLPTYEMMQAHNLKQLHFHLKNNESFLRFHRPQKHGDNLSEFRETIAWVNKTKEPIDGFEEGRIFNGFRFVFPLFYQNEHLGSVEVSFSVLSLMREFLEHYDLKSDFFIKKSIVDTKLMDDEKQNYVQSPLKDFYTEKKVSDFILSSYKTIGLCNEKPKTLEAINDRVLLARAFSANLCDLKNVITYLPALNPVTKEISGVFAVSSQENYLQNKALNTLMSFSVLSAFMMFLLVFIYRELLARKRLKDLNKSLKGLVKAEVEKNRQKDQIMTKQAKLAAMGEMIGAIAHQWRQPLNALHINIQNLDDDFDEGLLDKKFIDAFIAKQAKLIGFMSKTIDDFRNFFRIDKEKVVFSLKNTVETTAHIFQSQLFANNITLEIDCSDVKLLGYKSEFQQMLLNLVANAKDALVAQKVKNAKITIYDDENTLYIKDNAGGIPKDIIDKVFDAYFTTKAEGSGTGMGLYMSKLIVEQNMGEKLRVENDGEGAVFSISLTRSKVASK
jgi:signal transduction histidine kinase